MAKRAVNPAAGLEAEVRAAVEAALRESPVGPDVLARAARLAKAGRKDLAFGVLARAVRDRLSSEVRAKLDRAIFKAAFAEAKRRSRELRGERMDAAYVRRRIRAWARRRTGDLITNITDSQKESFRRLYAARVEQARAHAEKRTTRKTAGAVLGVRERMNDIARHGFGLTAPQSRRMAREIEAGRPQEYLDKLRQKMVRQRSHVIARTEASTAVNGAAVETWKAMGLAKKGYRKRWILTADDRLCDICEPLDGTTATISGAFPGGIGDPPAHPQCRCTVGVVRAKQKVDKQIVPGTEGRPDRREVRRPEPQPRPRDEPKPKAEPKPKPDRSGIPTDRTARLKHFRDGVKGVRTKYQADPVHGRLKSLNDEIGALIKLRDATETVGGWDDYQSKIEALREKKSGVIKHLRDVRAQYSRDMISVLRPDGGSRDFNNIKLPESGKLIDSDVTRLSEAVDHFRLLVSPNLNIGHDIVFKEANTGSGGWALAAKGSEPGIVGMTRITPPHVVVHELTHHLEYANNGTLAQEANRFLISRLGPKERLSSSGDGYKAFKDKFAERNKGVYWMDVKEETGRDAHPEGTHYPGRWYGWKFDGDYRPDKARKEGRDPLIDTPVAYGARELVTMGVEAVYENGGRFAEQDPDYFDWVVEHVIRRGMD